MITAAVAALLLAGCGNSPQEKLRDAKADYVQKTNEVEVMTLERTDFARQLLSNGKLKAARRSELSVRSNGPLAAVNFKNGDFAGRGATIASLDRKDLLLQRESASISLQKAELDLYDFLAGLGYPSRDTLSVPCGHTVHCKDKKRLYDCKECFRNGGL